MLRSRARRRLAATDGFTLVEMLVVVLIIGTLMAIGMAAFLNQRSKAQDTGAKTAATTAATAMLVFHSEHDSFAGATPAALERIESALGEARNLVVDATADTFTVTVGSAARAGSTYSIERRASGDLVRRCSLPGQGSCLADADAAGNRW
jgi:type IV pilus assembly protein PilA